jgi:hypothetical protein
MTAIESEALVENFFRSGQIGQMEGVLEDGEEEGRLESMGSGSDTGQYKHLLDDDEELKALSENAMRMTSQELRMKLFEEYWASLAEREAQHKKHRIQNKARITARITARASARASARLVVLSNRSARSATSSEHKTKGVNPSLGTGSAGGASTIGQPGYKKMFNLGLDLGGVLQQTAITNPIIESSDTRYGQGEEGEESSSDYDSSDENSAGGRRMKVRGRGRTSAMWRAIGMRSWRRKKAGSALVSVEEQRKQKILALSLMAEQAKGIHRYTY